MHLLMESGNIRYKFYLTAIAILTLLHLAFWFQSIEYKIFNAAINSL